MEWKQIKIGDKLTKYEISSDDGSIRDYKGKQLETKMVPTNQGREREVVTLFHDNKAWCIDVEALYIHVFETT